MFNRIQFINLETSFKSDQNSEWHKEFEKVLKTKVQSYLILFNKFFQLKKEIEIFSFKRTQINIFRDIPIKVNNLKKILILPSNKNKCDEILYLLQNYLFDFILYKIKDNLHSIQRNAYQERLKKLREQEKKNNTEKRHPFRYSILDIQHHPCFTFDITPSLIYNFCQFTLNFNTVQYQQKILNLIWNYFETISYILTSKDILDNATQQQINKLITDYFEYNLFHQLFQKIYVIKNKQYKLKNLISTFNIELFNNFKVLFPNNKILTQNLFNGHIFNKNNAKKFLPYVKLVQPKIKIINNNLVIYPIDFEFFKKYYEKINFIDLFSEDIYQFKISNLNEISAKLNSNIYIDSQFLIDCINFLGIDKIKKYLNDKNQSIDFSSLYLYGDAINTNILINKSLIQNKKHLSIEKILTNNTINTEEEKFKIKNLFKTCGVK